MGILQNIMGEISKLRKSGYAFGGGSSTSTYRLQSSESRVDPALVKALYHNEEDRYKLGGGFARPIINTSVGFIGIPLFRSEDEDAQGVLNDFFNQHVSKIQQVHRDVLRDGDAFVWITREEERDKSLYPEVGSGRLIFNIIPAEQVSDIIVDPVTGEVQEYIITTHHTWKEEGSSRRCTVTQRIRKGLRITEVEGDSPPDVEVGEEPTPWDFIPIVHFKNEADVGEKFGRSSLEVVEPFLKAYHDVMLHAIQGSKNHSTPKLHMRLKDVPRFLAVNFGVNDPQKFAQAGGRIRLEDHDLIITDTEEEAGYVQISSATGDSVALLKLLFYCIVDASETPEFAFGVHTPSSLSSVKEQMPILVRRIARQREHFTEGWQRLARIVLAMTAHAEKEAFSTYQTVLLWDEVDPRDETEVADTLQKISHALNVAITGGFLSLEAAAMFLAQYIDTMNEWLSDDPEIPGEREKIIRTRLLMNRIDDADLIDAELDIIDRALGNRE